MGTTTGQNWRIARYDGTTTYSLGGIPDRASWTKHVDQAQEAACTQRRLIALQTTNLWWELNFRIKLLNVTDYITSYCFIDQEGSLPSHNIYVTDGTDEKGFTNCYVDRCEIEVAQTGSVTANITVVASGIEDKSFTITNPTGTPLNKTDVTISTPSNYDKWTAVRLAIANGIRRTPVGNQENTYEVTVGSPIYTGRLTVVKNAAYGGWTGLSGSVAVTIGSKTFTFSDAAWNAHTAQVEELDLTYEILDFTASKMTIT